AISRSKLFSHGWGFVGRKKELQVLKGFAAASEPAAVVLSGIGGVGKSRLLREWSETVSNQIKVLFLLPGIDVKPSDFELLPQRSIVVIDDAHERTDLAMLFTGIAQARPETRFVLSTRPYGLTRVHDDLSRTNTDFNYESTVTLGDLSVDDALELAEEVIEEVG